MCRKKFSRWLEQKYGTIENFNQRSGAVFWSQEYQSFDQITPPVNSIEPGAQNLINAFYENPLVRLDFERFSSDSQIEFQNSQTAVLRKYTGCPVTTNATGLATNSIDYYKSTEALDCYAFDYYPGLRNARVDSFPYAFARGVKEGAPFWVLEFMSGGGHRLSGETVVQAAAESRSAEAGGHSGLCPWRTGASAFPVPHLSLWGGAAELRHCGHGRNPQKTLL